MFLLLMFIGMKRVYNEAFGRGPSTSSSNESQRINVMFLCEEWMSSKGGLPTFNREFAVNLAKTSSDKINVHCYVSQSNELDREDASKNGVNLITAKSIPGTSDPLDWLKLPPPELPHPDIVVGHGRKFGAPAYCIVQTTNCKWVQFVHVFCEDLGKYKQADENRRSISDTIEEGFGLVALEAISAGVPVLVTVESGIAKALEKVEGGKSVIVESENPDEWSQKIQQLSKQKPEERRGTAIHLRECYNKTHSWSTQCEKFKDAMQDLTDRQARTVGLKGVYFKDYLPVLGHPLQLSFLPIQSQYPSGFVVKGTRIVFLIVAPIYFHP